MDEGNLYHGFYGIRYQFYIPQIFGISRVVEDADPYKVAVCFCGISREEQAPPLHGCRMFLRAPKGRFVNRPYTVAVYLYGFGCLPCVKLFPRGGKCPKDKRGQGDHEVVEGLFFRRRHRNFAARQTFIWRSQPSFAPHPSFTEGVHHRGNAALPLIPNAGHQSLQNIFRLTF